MKIQHWAIIFVIIILPFSILCRYKIQMKLSVLKEETRYNNIIDNATYDAVSQILEISEELEYGKNVPLTPGVCEAALDRFFTTMAVNFNVNPVRSTKSGEEFVSSAQEFFSQYIPAVVIVGYDRMAIYSYSGDRYIEVSSGDYSAEIPDSGVTAHFTLDNKVTLDFPNSYKFPNPEMNPLDSSTFFTNKLIGYVGEPLDFNMNGIDDWLEDLDGNGTADIYEIDNDENGTPDIKENPTIWDPYGISGYGFSTPDQKKYIDSMLTTFTDNISYILLQEYIQNPLEENYNALARLLVSEDLSKIDTSTLQNLINLGLINQDYKYSGDGLVSQEASDFHKLRRNTIINKIQDGLNDAFNKYNLYADLMGVTYEFHIPEIGMDEWNNTIDDIAVLAFVQGLPLGYDTYYNNYSLGGARIVKAHNYYAEICQDSSIDDKKHAVYHRWYCKCIPKNADKTISYYEDENGLQKVYDFMDKNDPRDTFSAGEFNNYSTNGYPSTRKSIGITQEFLTTRDAKEAGYYACSECM